MPEAMKIDLLIDLHADLDGNEGAESLGGEIFLADEGSVIRTWNVGKYAADEKSRAAQRGSKPRADPLQRSDASMSAIDLNRMSGSSFEGMKPRRCQYAWASISTAL